MNDEFSRWMFEADDAPPDINLGSDQGDDSPPPDIGDDLSNEQGSDDMPPDLNMDDTGGDFDDTSFGDEGMDDAGFGEDESGEGDDSNNQEDNPDNMNLPEKVSAIMNNQLYQRYLSMLNSVGTQISQMTDNGDVLFSLMKDGYSELLNKFKKLDENIKLWMKNNFINSDYSKNLLFFNMCLNLQSLLNESFNKKIKKGVKEYTSE